MQEESTRRKRTEERLTRLSNTSLQASQEKDARQHNTLDGLTARQREVLQLLAEGGTAKEVAAHLPISPHTVEYHKYPAGG